MLDSVSMHPDHQDDPRADGPRCFGDREAVAASGVPLPSLRVLQAAGAIRARRVPKYHGGFRRMWPESEVLETAIAQALGEHFGWSIRLVATVMAKVQPAVWDAVAAVAVAEIEADNERRRRTFLTASATDCYGELIDRRFLFLTVPEAVALALPGWTGWQPHLLLGILDGDGFTGVSFELATRRGRRMARETLGAERAAHLERVYRLALVSRDHFLSKATINLSLQVRTAWRRLHGLDSRLVQEAVQLGSGKSEP